MPRKDVPIVCNPYKRASRVVQEPHEHHKHVRGISPCKCTHALRYGTARNRLSFQHEFTQQASRCISDNSDCKELCPSSKVELEHTRAHADYTGKLVAFELLTASLLRYGRKCTTSLAASAKNEHASASPCGLVLRSLSNVNQASLSSSSFPLGHFCT